MSRGRGEAGSVSCFYEGTVRHRRADPHREFRHPLAMAYIDLDELPRLLGGRLLRRRPGALRFRRRDYHGDPSVPLAEAVRDTVQARTGARPTGPVRMLTQLRSYGHCFNPVSFYYCMSSDGADVEAIVAEVTNTPWRERHAYVMTAADRGSSVLSGSFAKALHVSPFMSMDHVYTTHANAPGARLAVHIESRREGATAFDATMSLGRRELTRAGARRIALRYPLANLRVLGLIYAHALGLKLAGARVHRRPEAAAR